MKKNLIILTLVLVGTMLGLNSCKKGENDPFLSLSTRKARLSGEWKMTSANWSVTEDGETVTYNYNGTKLVVTEGSESDSSDYVETLSILKDGTFSTYMEEVWDFGGGFTYTDKTTMEGIWYFVGGNKGLEVENKERVAFQIEKAIYDDGSDVDEVTYEGKSNSMVEIICLDQLKKKEIIVLIDYEYVNWNGKLETHAGTKTYTLQ